MFSRYLVLLLPLSLRLLPVLLLNLMWLYVNGIAGSKCKGSCVFHLQWNEITRDNDIGIYIFHLNDMYPVVTNGLFLSFPLLLSPDAQMNELLLSYRKDVSEKTCLRISG